MPQLGLGLGLDKSSRLKSLAQLVKGAGGVLYLDARKADGKNWEQLSPRTLPNGIANSPTVQRVSEDYVIQASDITAFDNSAFSGFDFATISILSNQNTALVGGASTIGKAVFDNFVEFPFADRLTKVVTSTQYYVSGSTGGFIVAFTKGQITSLANAKTALTGTVIRYQLATPIDTINAPFTNPLIDLTKLGNNATLTNFAATQTDGYTLEATVNSNGQAVGYENIATTKADPLVTLTSDSATFSTDSTTFGNAKRIYVSGVFTATTGTPTLNLRFQDSATALTTTLSATSKVASFIGTTNSGATNKQIGFYCSPTLNATMFRQELINLTDNPLIKALETALGRQLTVAECDRIFPFVATTGTTLVSARPYLSTDGIDSYGLLANNPSVDIVGTEDFAIACGILTPTTLQTGFILFKGLEGPDTTTQYCLAILADGRCYILTNSTYVFIADLGVLKPNTFYDIRAIRKSGFVYCWLNGVNTRTSANVVSLITQPNTRIFTRTTNAGGTTHSTYFKGLTAYLILARGTYGDLGKLDGVLDKVARDYR